MSRRAWTIWGVMMALIILVILLTSNQTQPETTRVTKNINAPTISKDKDSDTTATQGTYNIDLNLITAKEPYEALFRTTDNVGKTVLIRLKVEAIREITTSNNKFTIAYGWPIKGSNGKVNTGGSGDVALIVLGPAWSDVSKGDDIEVSGIVAYIYNYDGHETPAMKQLPDKTLQEMITATAAAKKAIGALAGAVILVPNPVENRQGI